MKSNNALMDFTYSIITFPHLHISIKSFHTSGFMPYLQHVGVCVTENKLNALGG
jgi:hypothetical protein